MSRSQVSAGRFCVFLSDSLSWRKKIGHWILFDRRTDVYFLVCGAEQQLLIRLINILPSLDPDGEYRYNALLYIYIKIQRHWFVCWSRLRVSVNIFPLLLLLFLCVCGQNDTKVDKRTPRLSTFFFFFFFSSSDRRIETGRQFPKRELCGLGPITPSCSG